MADPTRIAVAVVEHGGCFLVGERPADVPLAGYYEFPGGKIEPGETPEQAAVRECREEAGLEVGVVGAYPVQDHQYEHGTVRLYFLACQPLDSRRPPTAPFQWVARHELGNLRFPTANRALIEKLLADGT